jgi:hypothetical protein
MHQRLAFAALAAVLIIAAAGTPAQAQTRLFVAAQGSDSNPCTFALPCRTFQHAHDSVAAGGEIDVLDPAGYGSVTINKAISIRGHGYAGISVAIGANGVTINAGPNDAVHVHGLLIDGSGVGAHGIKFNSGGSLTVENCVVRGMGSGEGILLAPSGPASFFLADTEVAKNFGRGITLQPTGAVTITATLNRMHLHDNASSGFAVGGDTSTGTINAIVNDSVSSAGNAGYFVVSDTGKAVTNLMVFRSVSANNNTGLLSQNPNATLRVSQSALTENNNGWLAVSGGTLLSAGDNTIEGNTSNETAPPTYTRK